ncbi:MAG: integron integrase, partial [Gemmatimonadetes bacterium]|nr:integron integrase [Gemmatimonadota bacterium]
MSQPQSGEQPKLLDRLRAALRSHHYSLRTEKAYVMWARRFVRFHGLRHPAEMAEPEINAFLTHLAVDSHVSASTQNQALSALLFLYHHVLDRKIGELGNVVRARRPQRLPVVMTRDEVRAVLKHLSGEQQLMAILLYGAGLRLLECLRLRVQDIDFESRTITVRDGKGFKDRVSMLPAAAVQSLQRHLEHVRHVHQEDLKEGFGRVLLPNALDRKYPNAAAEWGWQWVFPQKHRWTDRRTGVQG